MKSTLMSIQERNARVEADKAWETSRTRRALIAGMTYFIVVFFLWLIHAPYPWLNALVPALGYIVSTLTLPVLKRLWLKRYWKKA